MHSSSLHGRPMIPGEGAEPQLHAQVVMALQGDAKFLPDLFQRLKAAKPGDAEWMNQVAFLQELCSLAKHLQAASRTQLLSKLIGLGLFEVSSCHSGRHTFTHPCLRRKARAPINSLLHLQLTGSAVVATSLMLSKLRQVAHFGPQTLFKLGRAARQPYVEAS